MSMSPRLASATTSRPAARAYSAVACSACQPGAPRRSKHAICGLIATQAGPAASMTARQWAATSPAASGQSFAGSGSSPRTICERRSATRPASRSPKGVPAAGASDGETPAIAAPSGVDGLLELGAGSELRHFRRGDLDRLAGARVDALAGVALRDVELAEPREDDIAAAAERVLEDIENSVNGLGGLLLAQVRLAGDLIHELRLRHGGSSCSGCVHSKLAAVLRRRSVLSGPDVRRSLRQNAVRAAYPDRVAGDRRSMS